MNIIIEFPGNDQLKINEINEFTEKKQEKSVLYNYKNLITIEYKIKIPKFINKELLNCNSQNYRHRKKIFKLSEKLINNNHEVFIAIHNIKSNKTHIKCSDYFKGCEINKKLLSKKLEKLKYSDEEDICLREDSNYMKKILQMNNSDDNKAVISISDDDNVSLNNFDKNSINTIE